jgi:hypothetical protein
MAWIWIRNKKKTAACPALFGSSDLGVKCEHDLVDRIEGMVKEYSMRYWRSASNFANPYRLTTLYVFKRASLISFASWFPRFRV